MTDTTTDIDPTAIDHSDPDTLEPRRPLVLHVPPDTDTSAMPDRYLLKLAISLTPDPKRPGRAIPDTGFAETVAKCNGRTLRRYLQPVAPRALTPLLREKCEEIVEAAKRRGARAARAQVVGRG